MSKTYVTVQGDTWDVISYKLYGDGSLMVKLMEANPEWLDVVIFSAGIVLRIPDMSPQVSSLLPPWKRGGAS